MNIDTIGSPLLWIGFIGFVLAMLVIDLGFFHKTAHEVTLREATVWSVVWVLLAAFFNVGIYLWFGSERAMEFTAGYLVEKALAVDNIFVFVIIFTALAVPAAYQHRVLLWGVLGALAMRALFIFVGGALLQSFHFTIYVFGGVLAVTGVKLLVQRNAQIDPKKNPLVKFLQRRLPIAKDFDGDRFFTKHDGRRFATPLLLALVVVEMTDLVFALDSIPAVFAVTTDPFIVFTSNIFAILGLRSLYFLLAGVITKFVYLKVGLSAVLIFVGTKMLLLDVYKVSIVASLAVIAAILATSVLASLFVQRRAARSSTRPGGARPEVSFRCESGY